MPQIILIAAGGLFVAMWALAAGVLIAPHTALPLPVRFTSGAVLVSASVFALLAAHAGFLSVWLALGFLVIGAAAYRIGISALPELPRGLPQMPWWFRALFACYGLVYLIYVFAPEIQADAVTYHLGLVYEYVRLHAFPNRVGFYELLPQGVDMLFVPAFAIGAHQAAKLVHFSFLAATIPVVRYICLELGIPDTKACCAAAIFFIAPVTAIASTSAYTDSALVGCCCSILYLAIRWDRERDTRLLMLAALNAGFCYAIKPTFGWVAIVALAFFAARSKTWISALLFSGAAAVSILPWVIRSAALTRNPFAPFLNAWFPNAAFNPHLEESLVRDYNAFRPSFSWSTAILDYTILGGNQGMLGPAFLLLPLAVLGLWTKRGRWLIASALLLAMPVLSNTGTRFLMPSAVVASIALVSALPGPAAIALVAMQMIGSANPVIDLYDTRHDWRLRGIPFRAALGSERARDYLQRSIFDFADNAMIVDNTPEDARVFALAPVHQAYLPREALVYWQSALADRMLDLLTLAKDSRPIPASLLSWTWPAGSYQSVRVTAGSDLRIFAAQFEPGDLSAKLNKRGALSWTPWRIGESFDLRVPPGIAGADLLIWPGAAIAHIQAQAKTGEWLSIESAVRKSSVPVDIRPDVTAFIRRSGYRYILVPSEDSDFAAIGKDLLDHPGEWGVQPAAHNGVVWLFYISTVLT